MSKIAIIYYTMSGNTDYIANYIKKETKADLIKLIPKKEYPKTGFKKFFWGGKSAVMKETPELEEYKFDSNKYDYIIFGTPVWASTFTPPIRTFIKENIDKLANKKFAAFISYSGGGANNALNKLKEALKIDSFKETLIIIDPKDKNNIDKDNQIKEFCNKINKWK